MTWEGITVTVIVCACGIYLARRWYRTLAGKSGCGCGDCPNKQFSVPPAFSRKSKIENPK